MIKAIQPKSRFIHGDGERTKQGSKNPNPQIANLQTTAKEQSLLFRNHGLRNGSRNYGYTMVELGLGGDWRS